MFRKPLNRQQRRWLQRQEKKAVKRIMVSQKGTVGYEAEWKLFGPEDEDGNRELVQQGRYKPGGHDDT